MNTPLLKVAFVAMPYGTRTVELGPGQRPRRVDFDQLWERAIFPAMESIGYLAVRADRQINRSSILKDMLDMLYHAEIVIADVTAPSGNVYYEAGVRHGAQEKGCVLIAADWASPLFDIAQIPQIRYPLAARPKQKDFDSIIELLVKNIPNQAQGLSPVKELVDTESAASHKLREVVDARYEFGVKLRTAKQEAEAGNNIPLRDLCERQIVELLPEYALMELLDAVRDYLDWGELLQLIAVLNDDFKKQWKVMEKKAVALSRLGEFSEAIAILEQLIEMGEPSTDLFGTLGGRYRDLTLNTKNKKNRSKFLKKAINSYQRGVHLDLNEYYCASKLVVAYAQLEVQNTDDNLDTDRGFQCEMRRVISILEAAVDRAKTLQYEDEWLAASELLLSCIQGDEDRVQESLKSVLDKNWHDWKLDSLLKDLETLSESSLISRSERVAKVIAKVEAELPISQENLLIILENKIRKEGFKCRKTTNVRARPAIAGEVVISITSDGEETVKTAAAGEMLIENQTQASENYLVKVSKFEKSYLLIEQVDGDWSIYEPKGEKLAIKVDNSVRELLEVDDMFYIVGFTKTRHVVKKNDYLILNQIDRNEIYRVAHAEFWQTHEQIE